MTQAYFARLMQSIQIKGCDDALGFLRQLIAKGRVAECASAFLITGMFACLG